MSFPSRFHLMAKCSLPLVRIRPSSSGLLQRLTCPPPGIDDYLSCIHLAFIGGRRERQDSLVQQDFRTVRVPQLFQSQPQSSEPYTIRVSDPRAAPKPEHTEMNDA